MLLSLAYVPRAEHLRPSRRRPGTSAEQSSSAYRATELLSGRSMRSHKHDPSSEQTPWPEHAASLVHLSHEPVDGSTAQGPSHAHVPSAPSSQTPRPLQIAEGKEPVGHDAHRMVPFLPSRCAPYAPGAQRTRVSFTI